MFNVIRFIVTAVKNGLQSLHGIISTIRLGLRDVEKAIDARVLDGYPSRLFVTRKKPKDKIPSPLTRKSGSKRKERVALISTKDYTLEFSRQVFR